MTQTRLKTSLGCALLCLCLSHASHGQEVTKPIIEKGAERLQDNQQAQKNVDALHGETKAMEQSYNEELKVVEGLRMYNAMLARQLSDQESEMAKLSTSINNATLVERQVMPLLERMVDSLETFVAIDIPFLIEERQQRIVDLRALLEKSEFTTSEKTRRVFEAFQIETEFGYTLEAYKGKVDLEDSQFAVDFLRIGRIALMYRDLGGDRVGFWDQSSRRWQPLTERQYKRHITKGLKIAREEISPELITIPMLANVEVRP